MNMRKYKDLTKEEKGNLEDLCDTDFSEYCVYNKEEALAEEYKEFLSQDEFIELCNSTKDSNTIYVCT
jgi:hypothetical protein